MKTKTDVFNKKCVTALILTLIVFVCSLAPIFSASLVKAEDGPILGERPQYIFHPSFVRTNGSVLGIWDQPYMAGYMTNDSLSGNPGRIPGGADAVTVTVSFSGTDNSIIQDGNALAAGIAAQGPSSSGEPWPFDEPWIDYGYTMLLVVDNLYDWPFIQVVVWEVIEWGPNNLWPLEDPVVNIVDYFTWENSQVLTIDSEVTLTMEWSSNLLFYSATIGGFEYPLYIHYPNDIQSDYFILGTDERGNQFWEPVIDLQGTVKWFQFPGAWSDINIGQVGWHSYLSYPSYKMMGESLWRNVPFAYSVNGTTSWLDNTVNWGGVCYDNVEADYTYQHVHFYPAYGSTLEPDTLLWSQPACAMKTRTDGYFYVPTVATDVLKIEMLFDDSGVVGDQNGGTSPYGSIENYPDGEVDIFDLTFVASRYSAEEGDANWDYMADIHPDREINIFDVCAITGNYGYTGGTYTTDLSGVTVTFNTGETISPDSYGFVTIPQGATNFTVKQNGNPIGAMITFWFQEWVSPTSFSDPQDEWGGGETHGQDAYDDNIGSFVKTKDDYEPNAWTSYFYLYRGDIWSNQIKMYYPASGWMNDWIAYIDVYRNETWVNVNNAETPEWGGWETYSFAKGIVGGIRIKFKNLNPYNARVARVTECKIARALWK